MRTLILSSMLLTAVFTTWSPATVALDCGGSCTASNASAVMSEGVGLILNGSLSVVAASGLVTIDALEKTDGAVLLVDVPPEPDPED